MLLEHLFKSDDDLPLLAQIIIKRLVAGDKIRISVTIPSTQEKCLGQLQSISPGTPLASNSMLVPRLFIHWSKNDKDGKQWVRADTFDDSFELIKDEYWGYDWIFQNRIKKVIEGVDALNQEVNDKEPLLVTLIERKLKQGWPIILSINVSNPKGRMTIKHEGKMLSIGTLEMRSPQMIELASGNRGVQISYQKGNATHGYKGFTNLILPIADFDELYTAKVTTAYGQSVILLTNIT